MRPKICVPVTARSRDRIMEESAVAAGLPVDMVEWRVDFFAGYERELTSVAEELKTVLGKKELIITLRTEHEGGEPNGSRFDYFGLISRIMEQGAADYVDVEIDRDPERIRILRRCYEGSPTKIIGSYHDFEQTPSKEFIKDKLAKTKEYGCDVGKLACMPKLPADVDNLLMATAEFKEKEPDYPIITMSMGRLGVSSRLYGGLYGSGVSFGCADESSAPGQIPYEEMVRVFDRIYAGKKHIFLIGFMGTGKSTVSRELKYLCGRPEIDTDSWIEEQEGRTISEIFETEGEEYFREKETAMLDELGTRKPSIISCGGGMALRELNIRKMQALGSVVLLTAEPETVYERVKTMNNRPLLKGNMNVGYIRELMDKRMPLYERAATIKVATDRRMISDIAKEILKRF